MRRHLGYLLLLAGLAFLLAPHVGMLADDWRNWQRIADYQTKIDSLNPEQRRAALSQAKAQANPQTRAPSPAAGGFFDPFSGAVREDAAPGENGVFGIIDIPKIGERLPIYLGATRTNLALGVAQIAGTSLPVGGEGTHSVIAGHRGFYGTPVFRYLDELAPGDTFTIHLFGQVLQYQVTGTEVILPTETETLRIRTGKDMVTLLTCTPYYAADHRLLVHAERVPVGTESVVTGRGTQPAPGSTHTPGATATPGATTGSTSTPGAAHPTRGATAQPTPAGASALPLSGVLSSHRLGSYAFVACGVAVALFAVLSWAGLLPRRRKTAPAVVE